MADDTASVRDDILKLLREEGWRVNETVRDALAEFLEIVEEEMDGLDDESADEEEADIDED